MKRIARFETVHYLLPRLKRLHSTPLQAALEGGDMIIIAQMFQEKYSLKVEPYVRI